MIAGADPERAEQAKHAERVIDLYASNASAWAALRRDSTIERPWLDAFVSVLPANGRSVLELGCGSGHPIAADLIERGCALTGVDAAAPLVDMAARTFPDHRWLTADMRALPPLGRFHGVIAWHSLFHLTPAEQRAMFPRLAALALPGAALLFTSGAREGVSIGTFEGQPLYHASLDKAEYAALLEANGFDLVQHAEQDPACGNATIWLARRHELASASAAT
ncbi:class I SAM-dependent methyltransferase [Rhizobium sp. SG2393]|uniref:class I SAM-dependent methyltransferase n=1 Tax=Rhizobium sp. SG2393 TaxID=3276279 RepID=UPI00366C05D9